MESKMAKSALNSSRVRRKSNQRRRIRRRQRVRQVARANNEQKGQLSPVSEEASLEQQSMWSPLALNTNYLLRPSSGLGRAVQAKLTVNDPNDGYEQEANRVADSVMRQPSTLSWIGREASTAPTMQLKCAACNAQEEKAARASKRKAPSVSPETERQIESLKGRGVPLPDETRLFFERRMGAKFAHVRIHTDGNAIEACRAIKARAFTVGNNIAFNAGEYAPDTDKGRHLLAHELTHVVQQTGSSVNRMIHRAPIATDGGEWETNNYSDVSTATQNGVDIDLKFTPDAPTDAMQIGLTQTVRSQKEGQSYLTAGRQKVKDRTIPEGEKGAGSAIDQLSSFKNPLYATGATSSTDTLESTATDASWGQHGWRYTDSSGLQEQEGLLKDTPKLNKAKNAGQLFETTALATRGNQTGTYYGSVQWGWETDDSGKFTQLPLSLVSKGNPTEVFMRAAQLWNQGQTSGGQETIDLPTTYAAGTAGSLRTPDLIAALKKAKAALAKLHAVPATTNKDFEVRQMENELRRRQITVSVESTTASGDNVLAGKDDVYVKATYGGQLFISEEHGMGDGDIHDFQVPLASLLPERAADFSFEGGITIEIFDADSLLTGTDDKMTAMTWKAPFDETSHDGGDYKLKVKF
jgi:hypothetical protein